jgi:putative ABC transport system substrate-binding protein
MRRRDVLGILGGAAAGWPLAARSQPTAKPVIGFLAAPAALPYGQHAAAIHLGLKEAGFVEGRNLAIEYRWADGHYDRLPAMAAELVNRRVALIVTIGGAPAVLAAKAATTTIPIIFNLGADPMQLGVVASLNRPGGNITGIMLLATELEAKRLNLLREMVPGAKLIALLVNPSNPQAAGQLHETREAARAVGQELLFLEARTDREIETALASASEKRADALLICADTFFVSAAAEFAALSARYAIPTMAHAREYVTAGSLMSYGTDVIDAYRQTGAYAGRVLKGERPADLPVTQPTKFVLAINLKTAKALGLTVPQSLQVAADEVIE